MVTQRERQQNKMGRLGSSSCENKSPDTTRLSEAATNFAIRLPQPTINDMVQYYGGNKYTLAYELTRQELGTQASVEEYQRMYRNTLHDINRYLRKERTPSSQMKERFRKIYQPESNRDLKVHIKGCVHVSNTWYYKDATITVPSHDVVEFIKLAQDNINVAYAQLNGYYMSQSRTSKQYNVDITWLDNVQINMRYG